MKKANVILAMSAAVVLAMLAAPAAEALCNPALNASDVSRPGYCDSRYVGFDGAGNPVGTANPNINGFMWDTDTPAAGNTGTYKDWVSGAFGTGFWYFRANLGAAGVVGCPTDCLTVYVENEATQEFILWTAPQAVGPVGCLDNDFDFTGVDGGGFGITAPGVSPRPRVAASSRAGTDVNLTINVSDISAGVRSAACGGSVTGLQLFSQQAATRPSSDPAGWTARDSFAGSSINGAALTVDCTNTAVPQWVAVGIQVDGGAPQVLSQPIQVECDPNIADPPAVDINTQPRPGRDGRGKKTK